MTSDNYGEPPANDHFDTTPLDHDAPAVDHSAQTSGQPTSAQPTFGQRVNKWVRKAVIGAVFVGLLVITYFILARFLPQWWAERISHRVDGQFSSGITTGVALGLFCTLIPIVCFGLAVANRGKLRNVLTVAFAALGVLAAIPNLLTLAVVLGRGEGAHRGQFILDIGGQGFRGSSMWGAIIGAVIGAVVCFYIWRYRHRGRQLAVAKSAQLDAAATHDGA